MKDLCQYGNRPEDEWEILPWIPAVSYTHLDQQVFIMDLSFNPEITDELMVIYFDLNKEIFCITDES